MAGERLWGKKVMAQDCFKLHDTTGWTAVSRNNDADLESTGDYHFDPEGEVGEVVL